MSKLYLLVKELSKKAYNKYIMFSFMGTMFLMENGIFGKGYFKKVKPDFEMIDMNFFNSPEEILYYLINLGKFGRSNYFYLLVIDLILLVVLCVLQSTLIMKLLKGIARREQFQWLVTLPFLRSGADLFETLSYMILVKKFPETSNFALYTGSIFTTIKWVFMAATLLALVILIFINIRNTLRERNFYLNCNNKLK